MHFIRTLCLVVFIVSLATGCGGGGIDSSENTGGDNNPVGSANSSPVINGLGDSLNVEENQTSVLTVSASDSDGDSLIYTLSGDDAADLSISTDGVIAFIQAPDYEIQTEYHIIITVSDGDLSVSQPLTITIVDVIENNVEKINNINCSTNCNFPGTIILGKPTDSTISLNIVVNEDSQLVIEYGETPQSLFQQRAINVINAGLPVEITLDSLTASQKYFYRINQRVTSTSNTDDLYTAYPIASFSTQKALDESFNFAIHADSHVGIRVRGAHEEEKADDNQYEKTLANTLAFAPDFMIDLGDTFMSEKNTQRDFYAPDDGIDKTPAERQWVEEDYQYLRGFFAQAAHSVPLFLVNGNHEGEAGWEKDKEESVAVWANNLRKQYFPTVTANDFYSGSTEEENYVGRHDGYYAWHWGDALFVVLDPFWYGEVKAKVGSEWEWTLGKSQYDWLTSTLEDSNAKYKFVFMHNLVGGQNNSNGLGRGGALVASDWEWGGINPNNGLDEFSTQRPGWEKPIHQLLVDNSVNVVFHGHDHVYVKEEHIDGIIYQAVPQPSTLNDNESKATKRADEAGYDIVNGIVGYGSGFINVIVAGDKATVEYIRTIENNVTKDNCQSLSDEGCFEVAHSYQLTPNETDGDATSGSNNTTDNSNNDSIPAVYDGLYNIVLGRPTNNSIDISVLTQQGDQAFIEYGVTPDNLNQTSQVFTAESDLPLNISLTQLQANTRYYYRLHYKEKSQTEFNTSSDYSFMTQRSVGETFSFGVQGDSHPERANKMFNENLYHLNMQNVSAKQPDFYFMLGDDFSIESLLAKNNASGLTQDNVNAVYEYQRNFLANASHSAALFLVNGNHEQAARYLYEGDYQHDDDYPNLNNAPIFAANARNNYYPLPVNDAFYSADKTQLSGIGELRDYYAWQWGDALFVTIDPYWHSPVVVDSGIPPLFEKNSDDWLSTIGDEQYTWLKETLENSTAKYKFVFAHHVMGTGRGAADVVHGFEWGGYDSSGKKYEFDTKRPTWEKPIHQLLKDTKVTIFFQAHDHVYSREKVDGVIYQSVPNPADNTYTAFNAEHYDPDTVKLPNAEYDPDYGVVLANSGHLNVTVAADNVTVDYIAARLPEDEQDIKNGDVIFSYQVNDDNNAAITVPSSFSVDENQLLAAQITFTGLNNNNVVYSLSGLDADAFSISSTGLLTFNNAPDYETKNVYQLMVSVSDGIDATSLQLTVNISDIVDENANSNDDLNELIITSAAFKDTGSLYYNLPLSYTCDGADGGISPSLSWSGIPENTASLALTMHEVALDSSDTNVVNQANFTLFNISPNITSLPEGDLSLGILAEGDMSEQQIQNAGGQAYNAPCAEGAGIERHYVFTLYALSDSLTLNSNATQAEVLLALENKVIDSHSLTTKRIRYDADALANNLHVPQQTPATCEEKAVHFNAYSSVHKSVTCDQDSNQLSVVSHISDGLKTQLHEQQVQVGITQWIARLSLPTQIGHAVRVAPQYLPAPSNNLSCDGTGAVGVSVDGQLIVPFYKQGESTNSGDNCGLSDGDDYANKDTIVLGEVDQCYGHSPNGEGYHLHGAPICLMDVHDPSKPIAYMLDGIPLYFGRGGGTVENNTHAQTANRVTTTNYGAGLYEHLDYRPADVIDGTNPLNDCNAYDINGDGDISGYAYYSTQEPPYTIGCFMGNKLDSPNKVQADKTKLESERSGWLGQTVGKGLDVSVLSSSYGSYNNKTYHITEILVNATTSFLLQGDTAQVLWRVLDDSDNDYQATKTCFEFRYRADKNVTTMDETEVICSVSQTPESTLDFTPFGQQEDETPEQVNFRLDAWADNWFAAYLAEELIVQDSVAITTERSFNAETVSFSASYPLQLNFILKDYKENDTGLEYIGEAKQQMGDGGFIAQLTDLNTNKVVSVSNASWQCKVIHQAPLDKACANEENPVAGIGACGFISIDEPINWKSADFDYSSWLNAIEYSEAAIQPKDGYDNISWHDDAKLIWVDDLETDNTLLCKVTISAP